MLQQSRLLQLRGGGVHKKNKLKTRAKLSCTAKPTLKLRKTVKARGTDIKLGADVREEDACANASCEEPWLGGELSVQDVSVSGQASPYVEWRKDYELPGISDTATKVELRSTVDLKTGTPDVGVKISLWKKQKAGLSFEKEIPIEGTEGHVKAAVGTCLYIPNEVGLAATDLKKGAKMPFVAADIDKLDLVVEY